jgi:hypothetical protein
MISRAAVESVTSPDNLAESEEGSSGVRAVRDQDVVAELRRLEGLGSGAARRLGREAVIHIGGYVEPNGRNRFRRSEVWWVPEARIRQTRRPRGPGGASPGDRYSVKRPPGPG